jgi:hypothetical protein
MSISLMKQPGAWIPIVMSLLALFVAFGYLVIYGAVREPDEGAAAHLWQLLMVGQLPIVAVFALHWLRNRPRQALLVLAIQFAAMLAALAPVFIFKL